MRRIKVKNPERCIGCMGCVFACARTRYGVISTDQSAIKVKTQGGIETEFAIIACRACRDPACVHACPTGALMLKDGNVRFDEKKCTGCRKCGEACLVGAITFNEDNNMPIICVHCGNCARYCPHDVLELEKIEVA